MHAFERVDDPKFLRVTIGDKDEVYPALRTFFAVDSAHLSARETA
jgi:uncharacterized sporulation protein YeaH/YhbH (DUF444 family)